ncbi:MAG: diacylglycerol kinase family lipid kinase [Eubacteriales bacterium]|nr:diacylglycerol kinase family lipid kinase [Eubacteriales bacterium]
MNYFIVNPNSGGGHGQVIWQRTEEYLKSKGIPYELYFTQKKGDAREKASELTKGKKFTDGSSVIVISGDGTINESVNGIDLESGINFGFIPGGSGNDLSRSFGFDNESLEHTISILEGKNVRPTDIGVLTVNGVERRFAVSAGTGFDALTAFEMDNSPVKKACNKLHMGWMAYFILGVKCFFGSKATPGTVETKDGIREYGHLLFVSAHNHPFEGGGFKFAPNAVYDDGNLELCIVDAPGRLGLIKALILAKGKNGLVDSKNVTHLSTEYVKIRLKDEKRTHIDGEDAGMNREIEMRCLKGALRMLV